MFLIGEFSKIAQLSVRVLRHYDEIGLFRPERVDEATGYRTYSARQLPQLNRILALKMLGLSLDEIGRIVRDDLSADEVRGVFRAKKAQLEATVERERLRLTLVASRLAQIEAESFDGAEVVLKPLEPRRALALRERAPDFRRVMTVMLAAQREIRATDGRLGPSLAIFHDAGFDQKEIDWEFGVLADDAPEGDLDLPDGRLEARTLPAVPLAATTVVEGDYLGLHHGYSALGSWIETRGYAICGPGREVFWVIDEAAGEGNVTEIQFPVREAGA